METTLAVSTALLQSQEQAGRLLLIVAQGDPLERWETLTFLEVGLVAEALWGLFQVRGAQLREVTLIFLEGAKGVRAGAEAPQIFTESSFPFLGHSPLWLPTSTAQAVSKCSSPVLSGSS